MNTATLIKGDLGGNWVGLANLYKFNPPIQDHEFIILATSPLNGRNYTSLAASNENGEFLGWIFGQDYFNTQDDVISNLGYLEIRFDDNQESDNQESDNQAADSEISPFIDRSNFINHLAAMGVAMAIDLVTDKVAEENRDGIAAVLSFIKFMIDALQKGEMG